MTTNKLIILIGILAVVAVVGAVGQYRSCILEGHDPAYCQALLKGNVVVVVDAK